MSKLHVSDDVQLPRDFVTQTQAILAKRGKGKTYAAHVQAEELTKAGLPWVAIDGVGVWYGLRAGKSGTKAGGLPVLVLGGEHGDLPLEPGAGEVVADFVVKERQPTVLDVSEFSNRKMIDFVAGFVESLYRLNRDALHVFVEEADMFAPQVARYPGEELTLGAIDKMVRRGRQRGLGITLISQRPAVIHKNPLTQTEMMTVLGFTSPQDIAAIGDWFKAHGIVGEQLADVLHTLPSLGREVKGEAWVSSPEWLGFFGKVRYRAKETFDSSATPKPGAPNARPRSLADVPLADLQGRMKEYAEQKKANDPTQLKRKIADLQKQLELRPAVAAEVKTVEKPVVTDKQVKAVETIVTRLEKEGQRRIEAAEVLRASGQQLIDTGREFAAALRQAGAPQPPIPRTPKPLNPPALSVVQSRVPRTPVAPRSDNGDLPRGERAVLTAAAQYDDGVTKEQLTVLTGYKRSSRDAYIQRLREKGFVEDTSGRVLATDEGVSALGDGFEPLPTGDRLREHWMQRLPEGERKVMEVLIGQHPQPVDREAIDAATGYKRSSRDAYLQRLGAKRLVEPVGRGEVKASDELFG